MRWRAVRSNKVQDGSVMLHNGNFNAKCTLYIVLYVAIELHGFF